MLVELDETIVERIEKLHSDRGYSSFGCVVNCAIARLEFDAGPSRPMMAEELLDVVMGLDGPTAAAKALRVSRGALYRYVSGKRAIPQDLADCWRAEGFGWHQDRPADLPVIRERVSRMPPEVVAMCVDIAGSVAAAAEDAGVSVRTMQRYLNGTSKVPLAVAKRLMTA